MLLSTRKLGYTWNGSCYLVDCEIQQSWACDAAGRERGQQTHPTRSKGPPAPPAGSHRGWRADAAGCLRGFCVPGLCRLHQILMFGFIPKRHLVRVSAWGSHFQRIPVVSQSATVLSAQRPTCPRPHCPILSDPSPARDSHRTLDRGWRRPGVLTQGTHSLLSPQDTLLRDPVGKKPPMALVPTMLGRVCMLQPGEEGRLLTCAPL